MPLHVQWASGLLQASKKERGTPTDRLKWNVTRIRAKNKAELFISHRGRAHTILWAHKTANGIDDNKENRRPKNAVAVVHSTAHSHLSLSLGRSRLAHVLWYMAINRTRSNNSNSEYKKLRWIASGWIERAHSIKFIVLCCGSAVVVVISFFVFSLLCVFFMHIHPTFQWVRGRAVRRGFLAPFIPSNLITELSTKMTMILIRNAISMPHKRRERRIPSTKQLTNNEFWVKEQKKQRSWEWILRGFESTDFRIELDCAPPRSYGSPSKSQCKFFVDVKRRVRAMMCNCANRLIERMMCVCLWSVGRCDSFVPSIRCWISIRRSFC